MAADGSAYLDEAAARPLTVVGFAGGGGSSVAIKLALGVDPDLAMNHWLTAVLAHQRHFPQTEHHCADIFDVDPVSWRPGERIAFGWFSPDCTDFSKAKGKAPRSERIRGLAWSVIPWALTRRIDVIMLENVEEFAQWGPVYREGPKKGEPIPARRGQTFARWRSRLEKLGYVVEWRVLNAADYGAPTTRKRLYLVARCDGKPIVWPAPTHAPRAKAAEMGLKPWRGACEIIDWSQDCPSIFLDEAEVEDLRRTTGKRVQRPLVKATQKRIARGMERYVIGAAEPFIVPVRSHGGGGNDPRTACAPLRTVMGTKRGEFAVADAALVASTAHGADARAWPAGDPLRTATEHNDKAVTVATLAGLAHGEHDAGAGARVREILAPVNTVSAGGGDAALVTGALVRTNFHSAADRNGIRNLTDPSATSTGDGGIGLAAATLARQFGTGGPRDIEDPAATNTAGGERGGEHTQLITAYMAQGNTERFGREATAPASTIMGSGKQQQLVAASLDAYYSSGSIGADAQDPARTSTGKDRLSLIAAWLEQANTDMVGHELPVPVSTIVGKGCTQRLIEARLELDGGAIGRRAKVLEFLWSHFGVPTAEEWADPTGTLQARLKFGIVMIQGAAWLIVDIGLRMLTPQELAEAMGLPPEYRLDVNVHGEPISKTHQTQMIGNMVSPPPAAALIAANCPDLIQPELRKAA
jgi:DNA (cytosine-5)-methyltransferase 1